jgi:hypothetical protein
METCHIAVAFTEQGQGQHTDWRWRGGHVRSQLRLPSESRGRRTAWRQSEREMREIAAVTTNEGWEEVHPGDGESDTL